MVIENKDLMAVENELFREVTLHVCSSLDMVTAMQRCLPVIAHVIPVDRMGIHLYDQGLGSVRTTFLATRERAVKLNVLTTLKARSGKKPEGDDPKDLLISTQSHPDPVAVRIINNPTRDPVAEQVLSHFGASFNSSLLVLRLERGGKWLGSLTLAVEGQNRYTEKHARLLALLHEPFAIALANALEHGEVLRLKEILNDDNRYLRNRLSPLAGEELIGMKSGLKDVIDMIKQVAPLHSPVLLRGETGVGKDVVANLIHYSSPRKDGPFIKVNCGAIPETLLDSELFGHEKGAFTGAVAQKRGCFERAHNGTIFLDEIGELPPAAQVRMLRVIQYKEIQRVGGSASISVDIRIIAATHRNLEDMVSEGRFREDLWFRLNVFPVLIPPLRSRKADIPALTDHFIQKKSKELKLPTPPTLGRDAMDRLVRYDWPGNVRELENVIERALILSKGGPLVFDRLFPFYESAHIDLPLPSSRQKERRSLDEVVSDHIRQTLVETKGKVHGPGGAAELLGMHPSTLRSKMKKLGIAHKR
ncbi:MAG: Formate hydrogenlyase transcriptional activator [Syntrophorhabdus sp. PtaU1.Bin058]|nr:MAG: Formate hydrogenlyase transcriptional activator [Syntrophorhabdus sp. PtaU1.Bin058]